MKCYSCGKDVPANADKCPACGQPLYAVSTQPNAAKARRIDGCMMEEPSPKDFRAYANVEDASKPRRVDLRAWCSPIEDQGQLGSCTANAAVGALEFHQRKRGQPPVDLSRLFVYFTTRRMAGRIHEDSGAQISEAMASLLAYGAPPEDRWPYDAGAFTRQPGQDVFNEALKNQPSEYARVDAGEGVTGALARNYPVVFGIQLPMRCFQEAGQTGLMPMPSQSEIDEAKREGGHAMLIVGYDLDAKTYLVRNSWGEGWGERGYFRMPMAAMDACARPNAFWILGRLEQSGDFRLVKPALKPLEGSVAGKAEKMREDLRGDLVKDIGAATSAIRDRFRPKPPGVQ